MSEFQYDKLDHPQVLTTAFHPRGGSSELLSENSQMHMIPVEEGISIEGRFHPAGDEDPDILFFHGNGEIAADYDDIAPFYQQRNIGFLAVDFRGYGRSGGEPTCSAMMQDCHAIYDYVKEWRQEQGRTGPLFIMGRSLGSASAIDLALAHQQEIAGLLVDSGFAQTMPLLLTLGVDVNALGITEHDGFKNVRKVMRISKPSLFLHGQHDQIIPLASAEILQANSGAKNKQFQMIPGANHNNILEMVGERYFDVIRQFFDKIMKIRPKRYTRRRK